MTRTIVLTMMLWAGAVEAQGWDFEIPGGGTVILTLRIFDDGPGFSVFVSKREIADDPGGDVASGALTLAMDALTEFLARERWCMDGYTLEELQPPIGPTLRIEGRCK